MLNKVIKWEMFRNILKKAVVRKVTTSKGERPPYDVVMMFDLPIIIRAAIFGSLENAMCVEFLNYLKNKDEVIADNFIRGMRRRAIDNFFIRERQALDEGKMSFPWNLNQMKEIYNFNDEGMCYQNAGMANTYDSFENIIKEASFNRIGERKLFDKKICITYLYDVYTNVRYAGNMNNIKLKGGLVCL
ncbi:MAG: hypothetical protein PUB66_04060 [Oscillospiraceae bacterium]|nr:hypothetical protein [Oscillospiraceae bacterium]